MKESAVLDLLNNFIKYIRLRDNDKSQEVFLKITKISCEISLKVSRKIYEIGSAFVYAEGFRYVDLINKILKNNPHNLILRLIRQEILFNSEAEYDLNDMRKANDLDLQIFPENPFFLSFKSLIYAQEGEYSKALSTINRAIDVQDDNVDFLRIKALILSESEEYIEANKLLEYALALEPNYQPLIDAVRKIKEDRREIIIGKQFSDMEEETKRQSQSIKNIKLEFIELTALFIAILTLIVRIVTFDYSNYQNESLWKIMGIQIAINFPWLLGLILIICLVLFLHYKKR